MNTPPQQIRINHDDFKARFVGHTQDKKQFFITQPFVPHGRDFVACYVFDEQGQCISVKIHDLGKRTDKILPGNALVESRDAEDIQRQFLLELGDVEFGDILVSPFSHDAHETTFGLVPRPPEEDDDDWLVTAEPGDYMAFYPPWDGEYDT
jgi:hypothetical protein